MPIVLPAPEVTDVPTDDSTVAHLVEAVFTHLDSSSFGLLNKLSTDIDDAVETVSFVRANQAAITPGAHLCIDVEVMYVWDVDEVAKIATVERGMLGSARAEHDAGALIQIQPRVSNFDVFKELRNEINSWPVALFRDVVVPVSVGTSTRTYELAVAGAYRILRADYRAVNVSTRGVSWRDNFKADTAIYPSGKTITFDTSFSAGNVDVVVATPFATTPWALTTTMTEIGLTASMLDIPVLGAASRLIREAPRTDTQAQGQSRLAEEVPPMHRANERTRMRREADTRIHTEIARLRDKYPQRRA